VSAHLKTEKLSPFQLGLHHFNPPLKEISYKGDNEALHQRGKSVGVEKCVNTLKDKGMQIQTQCEVKISPEYLFSQKLNSLLFQGLDMAQFIAFKWNSRDKLECFQYMEGQRSWIS
jgi:hypothetical protein